MSGMKEMKTKKTMKEKQLTLIGIES